jgi:hypothetical protein
VINATSADAFSATQGAVFQVEGFKVTTTTSGDAIHAFDGGQITVNGNMNYGTCAGSQVHAGGAGAEVKVTANYTISGAAVNHLKSDNLGEIYAPGLTVTITGTPAFSGQFADALNLGLINAAGQTFSGSATGVRFSSTENAVILTGSSGNLTYFPGGTAGSYSSGGMYDQLGGNALTVGMRYLDSSGTYTPTANMVYCIIECYGAGGGGGGAVGADGSVGGGGGSGSYVKGSFSAATIGASQTVTIGAGGTAGASGGGTGGTGGTSTVGALISCPGGCGGITAPNGLSGSTFIGPGGAGGSIGTGGSISTAGNPGTLGVGTGNGVQGIGGNGGVTAAFCGGGLGGTASAGAAGFHGGGGGGGGSTGSAEAGGAGGGGIVIITEFISS